MRSTALEREIAKVHAPDAWFLKRGTTAAALRHALVGNAFTAARRRGKQIVLDTKDPDLRLGLHLGMSGRVLVDDEEAGDPLVYASNRRVPKWHRFGVHFADGGAFMLRDPRRLGAVELDPDESRLGPDALTLTRAQLDARARPPHRAGQGGADGSGAHRRARQPARRRGAVARRHRSDARRRSTIDADERRRLHKAIRDTLRVLGRRGGSHTGDMPRDRDAPCPRDGAPLQRRTVGGRTTYSCPVHQH